MNDFDDAAAPETPVAKPRWAFDLPHAAALADMDEAALEEAATTPEGEVDVLNWMTATQEQIQDVLPLLREFVDWMIHVHQLPPSVVPPCWYRHPALVQELYALYACYAIAYSRTDQGSGPLGFLERFTLAKARLRDVTTGAACNARTHSSPSTAVALTDTAADHWLELTSGERAWDE